NHTMPSEPATILPIVTSAGRGILVNAPLGVMRQMSDVNVVPRSLEPLNQRLPSDPKAIPLTYTCFTASSVGIGNVATVPSGATRPISVLCDELAYQKLPSDPVVHA